MDDIFISGWVQTTRRMRTPFIEIGKYEETEFGKR